ncbi:class III extradiol ring-cleavage dioxygenase [Variovorax sp. PCZ-1]|uniref:dioxygenase family protein n=1 Tax=Variovorax sp. PCZ-1 TaxID=2835533 RepID=UPI001BCC8639|nr:class III extradiol ring-cleavage dioxygenase [Variovorax sp. PCZ-1]MBS7809215.1 dioxygenase [Variovorax sp. PCZ-1]
MTTLPSVFISHGSPMFALEPGQAGGLLTQLGQDLPRPKAIAVISPHWMTRGAAVCVAQKPATIHDFGGFDPRLYEMSYPVNNGVDGIESAQAAIKLLADAGWNPIATDRWGLDHGTWVPLTYLYPKADVPVFQISLPAGLSLAQALAYGQALAGLREQGVLIIGSGSLTHNLSEFGGGRTDQPVLPYVPEFVSWVREAVVAGDAQKLCRTFEEAPHAKRAHPTDEHYQPLLVAMGASMHDGKAAAARVLDGGVAYGIISMDGFVFGDMQ